MRVAAILKQDERDRVTFDFRLWRPGSFGVEGLVCGDCVHYYDGLDAVGKVRCGRCRGMRLPYPDYNGCHDAFTHAGMDACTQFSRGFVTYCSNDVDN